MRIDDSFKRSTQKDGCTYTVRNLSLRSSSMILSLKEKLGSRWNHFTLSATIATALPMPSQRHGMSGWPLLLWLPCFHFCVPSLTRVVGVFPIFMHTIVISAEQRTGRHFYTKRAWPSHRIGTSDEGTYVAGIIV